MSEPTPWERRRAGPQVRLASLPAGQALARLDLTLPELAAARAAAYARAFVELTTDWIGKHRLEDHERAHPVYTEWLGFAWLDIQTGIRATNLCASPTTAPSSSTPSAAG